VSISSVSFWQQDQNWQNQQQAWAQQQAVGNALFSAMTTALSNQTTGLAGIANQAALNRVNSEIATLTNPGSSSTNSAASTSKSSSSASTASHTSSSVPSSSAVNLQSGATAASLLAGELPVGSLLSILA